MQRKIKLFSPFFGKEEEKAIMHTRKNDGTGEFIRQET